MPGHTLIPKRLPALSRPLFDDPPAFFVACLTAGCGGEHLPTKSGDIMLLLVYLMFEAELLTASLLDNRPNIIQY